jgi:hypothetical protein
MPYTEEERRTALLISLSDKLALHLEKFLETGEAKDVNFTLFRSFIKVALKHNKYEVWRQLKSVLNDVRDEYVSRMNDYERGARERNGDVI